VQAVNLAGRVAIVTGGGRGIGRAIALGLAAAGTNVVITAARNPEQASEVAQSARDALGRDCLLAVAADVTRESDCVHVVDAARERYGAVHILVNNAARGMRFIDERFLERPAKFWQADSGAWRMIVETNVNGPFLMARAVVPHLLAQRWGRLINISINHETMGRAGFSPYGPSKAALEAATAGWARELDGTGVTVNALLPGGITDTAMGQMRRRRRRGARCSIRRSWSRQCGGCVRPPPTQSAVSESWRTNGIRLCRRTKRHAARWGHCHGRRRAAARHLIRETT
jgi:NAD(P)-dependent dehydrogenase (short-subunit alcohol dehydrogenase family)